MQKKNFHPLCVHLTEWFSIKSIPPVKMKKEEKDSISKLFEVVFVQTSPKIFTLGVGNTAGKSPEHVNYLK